MAFSAILDLFASSAKKLILKKIEDFVLAEIKNKSKIDEAIELLENELELSKKMENKDIFSNYRIETLHIYYKLAKLHEKNAELQDYIKTLSPQKQQDATREIERRLQTLSSPNEIAVVYDYLAAFYSDKDDEKSSKYNQKALENIGFIKSDAQKAVICYRQAISFFSVQKYEKALAQIEQAIKLEPISSAYRLFKVRVRLALEDIGALKSVFKELLDFVGEFEKYKDDEKLCETYILLSEYYAKKDDVKQQLAKLDKAYKVIKEKQDGSLNHKKGYILTNISLLKGDEDIGAQGLIFEHKARLSLYDRAYYVELAVSLSSKGTEFYWLGEYDKTLKYFDKALAIREDVLGIKHPDTATSYNNIGLVYDSLGEYDKALEYHNKALVIREDVLGTKHPDTAKSYSNIGSVYDSLGEYDKTLKYFDKALAIREDVLGIKHPDTATSYNNIGLVYDSLGEYDKALEYHNKALVIREDVLGAKHPDTATSYNNIGLVYSSLGEYDKAAEYFKNRG